MPTPGPRGPPSPRLDALVAAAMGVSRSSLAAMFGAAGGGRPRVKRNHVAATRASATFERGDLVSVSGFGRLTVAGIEERGGGLLVDVEVRG